MLTSIIDFSSLFLQAFQQSTAASITSPRSGNPGYIVGKPLLALTGDVSYSVSFLELGGLLQRNEKSGKGFQTYVRLAKGEKFFLRFNEVLIY